MPSPTEEENAQGSTYITSPQPSPSPDAGPEEHVARLPAVSHTLLRWLNEEPEDEPFTGVGIVVVRNEDNNVPKQEVENTPQSRSNNATAGTWHLQEHLLHTSGSTELTYDTS